MNIDKFGHHVHKRLRYSSEVPRKALVESEIGVYDLQSKRLKGVRLPVYPDDIVNKEYVDKYVSQFYTKQELKQVLEILRKEIISSVKTYFTNTK